MPVRVDVSREEISFARNEFVGSRAQRVLHNFLVDKINEHRKKLETAQLDQIVEIQSAIKSFRTMLAQIHADDGVSQHHIYGNLND